ncbi:hypothetical protein HFU84_05015 [Acidithiobacillus sp. CV18-2]|nr:hypothetical protein [Acidithiobacillus sp. CV18-3]MBU2758317.1 hypothetical protein [Acidithiobacillus sp. BN09-2]MBU2776877.1 hypothetical protein [Acidithiobacillus sp. CV18-2]MBU2800395.1 hypothetical protein [Acidithiobacillus sp. VAN18-4]
MTEISGVIIRPTDGARLPVIGLDRDGKILVQGAYVTFETTIRAAIHAGYRLVSADGDLLHAWEQEELRDPATLKGGQQ